MFLNQWKSRSINVGNLLIGGKEPIRIQSMTTTPTSDVTATVKQILRLNDSGCEIIRLAIQGKKEAFSCEKIKNILIQKRIEIPLVADVHFFPQAAYSVIDFIEKVRINPGNFAERPGILENNALEKIEEKLVPLLEKCKKLKKSMRIGVNHGSLSERILSSFGNTVKGMVVSAIEYAKICRKHDFHNFCFSMKASSPKIMRQAYHMLVDEMIKRGWHYPFHLGVTEAGEGADGRIKSAIGIGSLLLEGIGDTIRVSLTEDPWKEIPPAILLRSLHTCYQKIRKKENIFSKSLGQKKKKEKVEILSIHSVSNKSLDKKEKIIVLPISQEDLLQNNFFLHIGCKKKENGWAKTFFSVDVVLLTKKEKQFCGKQKGVIKELEKIGIPFVLKNDEIKKNETEKNLPILPLISLKELEEKKASSHTCSICHSETFSLLIDQDIDKYENECIDKKKGKDLSYLSYLPIKFIFFNSKNLNVYQVKKWINLLRKEKIKSPFILQYGEKRLEQKRKEKEKVNEVKIKRKKERLEQEKNLISIGSEMGLLLLDNLIDGISIYAFYSLKERVFYNFSILQGCGERQTKTEFISCPGCGRTRYNIQEVVRKLKKNFSHFPGIKIAVMGCIVNGPGEMADADFGFVGRGKGRIDLYAGRKVKEKNIPIDLAEEKLREMIHNFSL